MTKKITHPPLYENEELIRTATGSIDDGHTSLSTWKPCSIHLTDRRLIAAQIKKVVRQFQIDQIDKMEIVMRKWIAGKMIPQIVITMKGAGSRKNFVAVDKPEVWLRQIAELGGMKVERKAVHKCASA